LGAEAGVSSTVRRIVHLDMDAFYASVEQRDRPELRGRPVAVGGSPESRSVVCAASYEARAFGVRSAMPCAQARRLCPDLVFVRPDLEKYSAVSRQLHALFREVTDRIEPLALDEAYLDVSENRLGERLAGRVAQHLKRRVREVTGLPASAGVGPNKLIAKLASAHDKPDGLCVVPPERVLDFLAPMTVDRLWGVGPVTASRLEAAGLRTVLDLRECPVETLSSVVGRWGADLRRQAFGVDERPVVAHREPRSRGAETTLAQDTRALEVLGPLILRQAVEVAEALERSGRWARTLTLKVRFEDFVTRTRARSFVAPSSEAAHFATAGEALLREVLADDNRAVRLVGLQASHLVEPSAERQLTFEFSPAEAGAHG